MTDVLLTFTGFHDPYAKDAIEGNEHEGPVLTALGARRFSAVYLFATPKTREITTATAQAIATLHPDLRVETADFDLVDPTDYIAILTALRREFAEIRREQPEGFFFISTASGTPQMHACWLLLVASGEFPATLLHTIPPRFLAPGQTRATTIDLTAPEFPVVRQRMFAVSTDEDVGKELQSLITALEIVGDDPAFVQALETALRLGRSGMPVLITGESGTGKEKVAQLIHAGSDRSGREIRIVNCAAIPAPLAESILFGHVRGAFTGATTDKKGEFVLADKGTLFLDEFAELPSEIQGKLLRAIEYGEVCAVGDTRTRKVDVRLIVATNKDLPSEVAAGRFREDLFYRVSVGRVDLPPLRRRRDDIPKLALFFVDHFGRGLRPGRVITPEALAALTEHHWPGNIRQLANTIQRAVHLCRQGKITAEDLALEPEGRSVNVLDPYEGFSLPAHLEAIRVRLIDRALEISRGNQTAAARLLDITQQAVSDFLKRRPTR